MIRIVLFIWAFILPTYVFAETYVYLKYVDESGVIHYTNVGSPSTPSESKPSKQDKKPYSKPQPSVQKAKSDYNQIINKHADKYDMDPHLIKAVITAESGFDSGAVSSKGAMGLMQLMPSTASILGVSNPFNPDENIEGGVRYLKNLLGRYNGDLKLALAAYNAGPKTVEKYGAVPPITETRNYVKKILAMYKPKDGNAKTAAYTAPVISYYKITLEDGTILFTNSRYQ